MSIAAVPRVVSYPGESGAENREAGWRNWGAERRGFQIGPNHVGRSRGPMLPAGEE